MEQVRVGMIGCGGHARWHLHTLSRLKGVSVVALVDPDPAQIAKCRAEIPSLADVPAYDYHPEMIAHGGLDAVEICTPHTLHCAQVQDAFAAGLHVLCEKPLSTTVADCEAVIRARDTSGKVGVLGYQRHFMSEFKIIREAVASGDFGKVQYVAALQAQEWKRFTMGTWRQVPELSGGGQLNDSGSHLLDVLLWCTGLKPATVSAVTDARETPVDINSSLSITFEGGATGSVAVIGDAHGWHEEFTVWCDRATFYLRDGHLAMVDADGVRTDVEPRDGRGTPDENFVAAIRGEAEVASPFECGLDVIRLTEAAWRSAANGGAPERVF